MVVRISIYSGIARYKFIDNEKRPLILGYSRLIQQFDGFSFKSVSYYDVDFADQNVYHQHHHRIVLIIITSSSHYPHRYHIIITSSSSSSVQTLQQSGVTGIMCDTWWGIVEQQPQQYNFTGFDDDDDDYDDDDDVDGGFEGLLLRIRCCDRTTLSCNRCRYVQLAQIASSLGLKYQVQATDSNDSHVFKNNLEHS